MPHWDSKPLEKKLQNYKQQIEQDTMSLKKSTKWVAQYRVQSSNGKKEYVISHCEDGHYECSCPNWTRNMPREDCKHILRKKLELLQVPQITVGLSITQSTGRKFR